MLPMFPLSVRALVLCLFLGSCRKSYRPLECIDASRHPHGCIMHSIPSQIHCDMLDFSCFVLSASSLVIGLNSMLFRGFSEIICFGSMLFRVCSESTMLSELVVQGVFPDHMLSEHTHMLWEHVVPGML